MADVVGGRVVWDLDADTSKLEAGLKKAKSLIAETTEDQAASITKNATAGEKVVASSVQKQKKSYLALATATATASAAMGMLFKSSIDASVKMENALTGLSTVSRAFNQDIFSTRNAAISLANDGLMSVQESADSLKNLLATGFSLDEATNLMYAFKDAAAFNRQGTLAFGEAIIGATQGIKNQNSILVDNVGISKNLSVILKEQGLSVQDLGKVTSDASVRQKLYNGLLKEGAVFSGDADKASRTLGGQLARLNTNFFNIKTAIGDVLRVGYMPLISYTNDFLSNNKSLVVSLAIAGMAATAFAATVVAVGGSIAAVVALIGGPFTIAILAVTAIFGGVAFRAAQKFQSKIKEIGTIFTKSTEQMGKSAQENLGSDGKAGKSAKDLAKKLADIDKQIVKSNQTFQEQLAEMVRGSQEKVANIKSQIDDENKTFTESEQDKTREFERSQVDAATAHERRVAEIKSQIDEEVAKGTEASQTKIADLQRELNQEQADYELAYSRRKEDYDRDLNSAKEAHNQKIASFQAELDQEQTMLNNHAADVAVVRDFQFRDEIQKLKDNHAEQLVEFENQKNEAIKNAKDTTSGIATQLNDLPNQINDGLFSDFGTGLGEDMGKAFKDSLVEAIKDIPSDIFKGTTSIFEKIGKSVRETFNLPYYSTDQGKWVKGEMANGGDVQAGEPYVVGERGWEYFVPSTDGTIIPHDESVGMGKSGSSITNYITMNRLTDIDALNRRMSFQAAVL